MQKGSDVGIQLSIQLIGSVRVSTEAGDVVRLPVKATALLVYLALTYKEFETKEFIKGLLWSESSQKHASGSLRQCLKKLNDTFKSIDFRGFLSNGTEISLNRDLLRIDIIELHDLLIGNQFSTAKSSYNLDFERFLNTIDVQDQSFNSWIHVQRQSWSERLVCVLEKNIRSESNDHNSKLDQARMLYLLDPTHEEACRFIMRAYASRDNLGPILEIYAVLCSELEEKYGAEPSAETAELYLSIQTGSFQNSVEHTLPLSITEFASNAPIIGVNDFLWSGLSTRKESLNATFFRNELLAALSKFREWIVVDTKQKHKLDGDTSEVDYIVDGTCYQVNDFTDLLITMTQSKTGQVWSETLRIETESWIPAQRSMVSKIAVALNVYLSAARLTNTISQQGLTNSVHELWLKGYQSMLAWDPTADQSAESLFRSIIERSPTFAPAYSSLATVLNTRHFKYIGKIRTSTDARKALHYAQKGVALDPLESRTQLALGFSHAMNDQFEQAQLHLSLARELNPYSPVSVVPCAHGLSYCGLHTEAVEIVDWAEKINWKWMPSFHWGYILCVRFFARDYKKAIFAAKLANGVIVDLHAWHAAALAMDGQIKAANNERQKFINIARENWQGQNEPNDINILHWFLSSFPIRLEDDLNILKLGLARAGLSCATPIMS